MNKFVQYILLSTFLFSIVAQPRADQRNRPATGQKPIYMESHVVPIDSQKLCYLSYRVPYANLVFVREGNSYKTGLTLRVEVTSKSRVETRESSSDMVIVDNYDETNRRDKFLQGILKFRISTDELIINPLVELHNTGRQVPLRPFDVNSSIQEVIVVEEATADCEKYIGYQLSNYENSIPYSDKNYQLYIPIFDSEVKQINVVINQNDKEIVNRILEPKFTSHTHYEKCDEKIVLVNEIKGVSANIYLLNNFSYLLNEGEAELTVTDEDENQLVKQTVNVVWVDKPISLNNSKYAYQLLEIVESEENLDTMLSEGNNDYDQALEIFWQKYDPNRETPFNQLMYEFYSRADKAYQKYTSTGDRFGSLTDRGKVFIKYGQPSEVDRFYTEKNEIAEVWKYQSPKMEFVFVDASGLGNYKLIN